MSDNNWITESVVQFTHSPLWRTPIDNFVDDHCSLFADDDEMKLEQTQIHMTFRKLADNLLTSFVQEIGVSLECALDAVRDSVNGDSEIRKPAEHFLNYLFYIDDFRSFHKMMVRRNIELDILASRALHRQQGDGEAPLHDDAAMDEEEALRLAIEASLQDDKSTRRMMELEDIQIQEALALSIAAEEDRIRRAEEALKEEHAKEKLSVLEKEKNQVIEKLEARALEVRKETMLRGLSATQEVPPTKSSNTSPVGPTQHEDESKKEQGAPAAVSVPPSVPVASPAKKAVPPRIPPGKGFGFKTLPSIQPSFKQLKSEVLKSAPPPQQQQQPSSSSEKLRENPNATGAAPGALTLQEVEERARYMREQREKILMRNKANREKELNDYAANKGKVDLKPSGIQECEKQVTVELARRLREDIVREATK